MLTYNLTDIGTDSLYEYLYKCIKNDIISRKIKAGERLPSKRTFAKNLGISVITVENAYGLLMDEGYVFSLPKKGFFVSEITFTEPKAIKIDSPKLILSSGENAYIADFSSNQTETEVFPFSTWTKTMREVMVERQNDLMINPPCGGIMELRENIAKHLRAFRGMNVSPEQIIVGAGTEYLYSLLIQLLGKDMTYGIENPGYHKSARIYDNLGVSYSYVDMDHEGVKVDLLEKHRIDVIHVSPSHHFPTGIVMPVSRRYDLLSWSSKSENHYIIEDDYDSELRLCGKPLPTLQSIDVTGKVIYMNTFTKTLSSTVRISYMVLPEKLANRYYKRLGFYSCTVSNFEQYTLARFIESGSFEKHINRLRNYYQGKRDMILAAFEQHAITNFISISEEEAGVHFLMQIHTDKPEKELITTAKSKGIKLNPLSNYYFDEQPLYENIYVMNYSSIQTDLLKDIVSGLFESIN